MKKWMAIVALGLLLAIGSVYQANAAVLTFDDVSNTTSYAEIPGGYGGLTWSNIYVIYYGYHLGSGYDLGRVSGEYTAWDMAGEGGEVTSGVPFQFNGAYFTSAWDESLNIFLEGWLGTEKKYDVNIWVNNDGPTWFQADFLGIDRLVLSSPGNQFVIDNFTVNAVPIPAAVWLLGSGLVGLAGLRRRIFK